MKVTFNNLLKAYSGACDGLVYYYNPRLDRIICRRYVRPRTSPQNALLGVKSRNLSKIPLSDLFKQDLRYYAESGRQRGEYLNWRNVLIKMMYEMEKSLPDVDLATITKAEIYTKDLPCRCVKSAVEAGLLAPVRGYQALINAM